MEFWDAGENGWVWVEEDAPLPSVAAQVKPAEGTGFCWRIFAGKRKFPAAEGREETLPLALARAAEAAKKFLGKREDP